MRLALATRASMVARAVPAWLEAEGHVVPDRQVRVERVALEDHGDPAVGGGGWR